MVASIPAANLSFIALKTIILQPVRGYRPGLVMGMITMQVCGGEMGKKEKQRRPGVLEEAELEVWWRWGWYERPELPPKALVTSGPMLQPRVMSGSVVILWADQCSCPCPMLPSNVIWMFIVCSVTWGHADVWQLCGDDPVPCWSWENRPSPSLEIWAQWFGKTCPGHHGAGE